MSVRPPRILSGRATATPLDALQIELLQEQASTLGRVAAKLEDALAALAAHDAAERPDTGDRAALLAAANDALWQLIVQREACGLRTTEDLLRDYRVPPALAACYAIPAPRWRRHA